MSHFLQRCEDMGKLSFIKCYKYVMICLASNKFGGRSMFDKFWKLAISCSVGSILIVIGIIVQMPIIYQLIVLVVGLIVTCINLLVVTKYLLTNQK